jgi:hypothetical protein
MTLSDLKQAAVGLVAIVLCIVGVALLMPWAMMLFGNYFFWVMNLCK